MKPEHAADELKQLAGDREPAAVPRSTALWHFERRLTRCSAVQRVGYRHLDRRIGAAGVRLRNRRCTGEASEVGRTAISEVDDNTRNADARGSSDLYLQIGGACSRRRV